MTAIGWVFDKNLERRGSAIVVSSRRSAQLVSSHIAVEGDFLEIVDFDVVNATILIVLFSLIYIFTLKIFKIVYILKNRIVSYVSRPLRSRKFVQRKQKWHQLLYTLMTKSIINTGKRLTPSLALQRLFYLVFRTNPYYYNLLNFAHSKSSNKYL